ncbi:dihydroflavonol-4-reductase [Paractinoplanes deccanensis]|uniref:Dihydroflavonol-4-reductase n=2 Tax=Paractinoplanes deccanensis TaxID=113561 RepID=A0ABQ3YIF3_9ACTN|nr:NAD-dependent epimerase/dehydratase family protein [Actinoplanes deccanensis]GID79773.1 dihydroflavonol-4-reductase [Actinoplanes deccanensis]
MGETVLVTGGSGFIGSWCAAELLERGYQVRTTVRDPARAPAGTRAFLADLTRDDGWDEAVAGCDFVLHVASPVTTSDSDPGALVAPAREGTLRVLRAAVRAGVRRVVYTSSSAAATPRATDPDGVTDETLWTDPDGPGVSPYRRSKVLAERAAWDLMAREGGSTELSTVLPGWTLGPLPPTPGRLGSLQVVQRLLNGSLIGLPRLGFEIVDVRDIADLHLRAMTHPAAAGQRFLGTGDFLWMTEIARIVRSLPGVDVRRVPRRRLPDLVVKLAARRDADLRTTVPNLGHRRIRSSAKARRMLGWTTRPPAEAIEASARGLGEYGVRSA